MKPSENDAGAETENDSAKRQKDSNLFSEATKTLYQRPRPSCDLSVAGEIPTRKPLTNLST